MTPEHYNNWYTTSRGSWIGDVEFNLINNIVSFACNDSLIDVGCGTGYFTRRFVALLNGTVVGVDRDIDAINFANKYSTGGDSYIAADAEQLPYNDSSFDHAIAIASLCFAREEDKFLDELFRVARKTVTVGLLNRRSLLWLIKRKHDKASSYSGAHWHTPEQGRSLFDGKPVRGLNLASAVFYPFGGEVGKIFELLMPSTMLVGGFLLVSAKVEKKCE